MVTANSSMDFVIFLDSANFGSVIIFSKRNQQLKLLYKFFFKVHIKLYNHL